MFYNFDLQLTKQCITIDFKENWFNWVLKIIPIIIIKGNFRHPLAYKVQVCRPFHFWQDCNCLFNSVLKFLVLKISTYCHTTKQNCSDRYMYIYHCISKMVPDYKTDFTLWPWTLIKTHHLLDKNFKTQHRRMPWIIIFWILKQILI